MSKLELLASPGTRQSNVKEAIEYFDTRIAQCLFTDFLLFGHTKIGTQALSTTRIDDVYVVALGGWMKAILEVINRRAIPQLLALNGIRVEQMPRLEHGRVGNPDLQLVGQYITALAGAGMMLFPSPDGELEETLLELAELPVAEEAARMAAQRAVEEKAVLPDLILIDGGANDTDFKFILNPITGANDLRTRTERHCFDDMCELLKRMAVTTMVCKMT